MFVDSVCRSPREWHLLTLFSDVGFLGVDRVKRFHVKLYERHIFLILVPNEKFPFHLEHVNLFKTPLLCG